MIIRRVEQLTLQALALGYGTNASRTPGADFLPDYQM